MPFSEGKKNVSTAQEERPRILLLIIGMKIFTQSRSLEGSTNKSHTSPVLEASYQSCNESMKPSNYN